MLLCEFYVGNFIQVTLDLLFPQINIIKQKLLDLVSFCFKLLKFEEKRNNILLLP